MIPTMTSTEHRATWDRRWADTYATKAARDAAYHEHQATLAAMCAVFTADRPALIRPTRQ